MKHKTNWNKTLLKDNTVRTGDWFCGAINSEYHFDNNIQDDIGDWFKLLGKFELNDDFYLEVDRLYSAVGAFTENKEYYEKNYKTPVDVCITRQSGNRDSYYKSYVSMEMFNRAGRSMFPVINCMARYFGITIPKGKESSAGFRTIMQDNGQMYNMHVDDLWHINPEDPSKIVRITVMLDDWRPGQFFMYGNYVYQNWKAGDIHIFDWANVPHATANASNKMRPNLQITGVASEKTEALLSNMNENTIIKLKDIM